MRQVFGFEFDQEENDFFNVVHIIDHDKNLSIVESSEDVHLLKELLEISHTSYDIFPLYQLSEPVITTDLFWDFGFETSNHTKYLYQESIIAFHIMQGEDMQRQMALLQIDEHLIATEKGTIHRYFVDRQLVELIQGYEKAYDIEVSFLDLDKTCKND